MNKLICLMSILLISYCRSIDIQKNRVLAVILIFEFSRTGPFMLILNEYHSMCEAGWDPTILLLTTEELSDNVKAFFQNKVYCYRTQNYVRIEYNVYPKSSGIYLAEKAKIEMKKYQHDYDVFIYQEDDIIVQLAHLVAYVSETEKLVKLFGEESLRQYSIGFQRYCRTMHHHPSGNDNNINNNNNNLRHSIADVEIASNPNDSQPHIYNLYNEKQILIKEYFDEFPFFKPICLKDNPYVEVTSCQLCWMANPHQAIFILTKQQLDQLEQHCSFLNMSVADTPLSSYSREYTSSLGLFENHIIAANCHLKKLIPGERLHSFLINHYHCQEKFSDHRLVHDVVMHIKAGMVQLSNIRSEAGYYSNQTCWSDIVKKYQKQVKIYEKTLIRFDHSLYLLENGMKRRFKDRNVVRAHGYDSEMAKDLDHKAIFDALPTGPEIEI